VAAPVLPPATTVSLYAVRLTLDAVNVFALMAFTLLMLPPLPVVAKLATVVLPVTFKVPATLTPVPVTITILALPTALMFTLPLADGIFTLLLPLLILELLVLIPVS
jgi:hypothetical protein